MPGELWRQRRTGRPIREDVPIEDDATNISKANRTHEGFRVLREKVAELAPDVLIVFSDDQLECFDFNNYPAFAIYVGEEFRKSPRVRSDPQIGRHADPGFTFKGHPELAVSVLTGVMARGFDPALVLTGHENELGHPVTHREPNWMTYRRLTGMDYPFALMTWGESIRYLPADEPTP